MGYNKLNSVLLCIVFAIVIPFSSCQSGGESKEKITVTESNFYEVLKSFEQEGEYYFVRNKDCQKPIMDSVGCELPVDRFDYNRFLHDDFCLNSKSDIEPINVATVVKGEFFAFKAHQESRDDLFLRFGVIRWQFRTKADAKKAYALGEMVFKKCEKINTHHFMVGPYWYVFAAGGNYADEATGKAMRYFKERVK